MYEGKESTMEMWSTFRGRWVMLTLGAVMVSYTKESVGVRLPASRHRFNPPAHAEQSQGIQEPQS